MSLPTFNPVEPQGWGNRFPSLTKNNSVAVVGAGVFGAWTALFLQKKGLQVTLLDGHGIANRQGSSGDESRILRASYGNNKLYFELCLRSLELWKEYELQWNTQLFKPAGVLWLCPDRHTPLLDEAADLYASRGLFCENLSPTQINERYPDINAVGLDHAVLDPAAGYLLANHCTRHVVEEFVLRGGHFREVFAKPGYEGDRVKRLELSDGSTIQADVYLFATGPWLGQQFPEALGQRITCSQQEVFYFDIPTGNSLHTLPAWLDADGEIFFYGIPASPSGFKIGVDRRGPLLDPSSPHRQGSALLLEEIRAYLAMRFPSMADARLNHHRICPYENSPDGNFIIEGHPTQSNVVFLGGGSGHGFKHGPALGEWVARHLVY
jgi:glycine/D-amino acid oxidase-like deaminating enzyme